MTDETNGKGIGNSIGIVCSNCGMPGHVYRCCTFPVTSYGIICFRLAETECGVQPQYLMVQRKDSLGFVEFVRGKYDVDDLPYVGAMLTNMTEEERDKVLNASSIDVLWEHLWRDLSLSRKGQAQSKPAFVKDLEDARGKFSKIQSQLKCLAKRYASQLDETEWGFPKGRRALQEGDLQCALREFEEETGLNPKHMRLLRDNVTIQEMFRGSNGVYYRHLYFVAKASPKMMASCRLDNTYEHVNGEIRAVSWFNLKDCLARIRDVYPQRKTIVQQVHRSILDAVINTNVMLNPRRDMAFITEPVPIKHHSSKSRTGTIKVQKDSDVVFM